MAFVPAANTVMAELRYLMNGEQAENTLYFDRTPGTISAGNLPTVGSLLAGWWDAAYAPFISNQVELNEIYLTDLTSATGPTFTFAPTVPLLGQDASPPMPKNVSLAVSFRTAGRGRSARGRNYIYGLTEADITNDEVSTTTANGLQAGYNTLIGALASEGYTWVVVSRYLNGNQRAAALKQPVTSVVVVDNVVDSQRRRLPGRGR